MSDEAKGYIAILLICSCFTLAVIYFFLLYRFAGHVKKTNGEAWLRAQEVGRSRESFFQTSYRIISNPDLAKQLSPDRKIALLQKQIKFTLGISLTLFMLILIGFLYVSVNKD
jgi:hypothetical protein